MRRGVLQDAKVYRVRSEHLQSRGRLPLRLKCRERVRTSLPAVSAEPPSPTVKCLPTTPYLFQPMQARPPLALRAWRRATDRSILRCGRTCASPMPWSAATQPRRRGSASRMVGQHTIPFLSRGGTLRIPCRTATQLLRLGTPPHAARSAATSYIGYSSATFAHQITFPK